MTNQMTTDCLVKEHLFGQHHIADINVHLLQQALWQTKALLTP